MQVHHASTLNAGEDSEVIVLWYTLEYLKYTCPMVTSIREFSRLCLMFGYFIDASTQHSSDRYCSIISHPSDTFFSTKYLRLYNYDYVPKTLRLRITQFFTITYRAHLEAHDSYRCLTTVRLFDGSSFSDCVITVYRIKTCLARM